MPAISSKESALGNYLRSKRASLDPAAFGLPSSRRRTPGLRREEVAQRANISPTWYTWLEQGRGGAPSADVLDRISRALMLTEVEREHLHLIGIGRPPEPKYHEANAVTPRLQRVLDALEPVPALIRTPIWDVVAWNSGVAAVMTDFGALPPSQRNILRFVFTHPNARAAQRDWKRAARHVVGAFRIDVARAGADAQPLVDELSGLSFEFQQIWSENTVHGTGEGLKQLQHPALGTFSFEYSTFLVDGRTDLTMVVYNPLEEDTARMAALHER